MFSLVQRLHRPARLAGFGIDGDQSAFAGGGEHHPVLIGYAARPPSCAHPRFGFGLAGDVGIILPQQFAGTRVERMDDAQSDSEVDDAIDFQRLGITVERVDVIGPGQAELADIGVADLGQRAIMLFAVVAAIAGPVRTGSGRIRHRSGDPAAGQRHHRNARDRRGKTQLHAILSCLTRLPRHFLHFGAIFVPCQRGRR